MLNILLFSKQPEKIFKYIITFYISFTINIISLFIYLFYSSGDDKFWQFFSINILFKLWLTLKYWFPESVKHILKNRMWENTFFFSQGYSNKIWFLDMIFFQSLFYYYYFYAGKNILLPRFVCNIFISQSLRWFQSVFFAVPSPVCNK